jgi:hypothetical protein
MRETTDSKCQATGCQHGEGRDDDRLERGWFHSINLQRHWLRSIGQS